MKYTYVAVFLGLIFVMSSCGETVRGVWRDGQRIGRGVKTIFVADS